MVGTGVPQVQLNMLASSLYVRFDTGKINIHVKNTTKQFSLHMRLRSRYQPRRIAISATMLASSDTDVIEASCSRRILCYAAVYARLFLGII